MTGNTAAGIPPRGVNDRAARAWARPVPADRTSGLSLAGRRRPRRTSADRRLLEIVKRGPVQIGSVFALATVIAWLRRPAGATDIVYAEDGRIFLGEYERLGFWGSLFHPYTGYLQFWPRVLVGLIRLAVPIDAYAFALVVVCALFVGAMSVVAFLGAATLSSWLPWRAGIAALTVLMPTMPLEAAGNVANLHWFAFWGALWLIILTPRTWRSAIVLAVLAATFALTEIQTAALLPLFLLRLKDKRSWIVRVGLLLGLVAQGAGYLMAPRAVITAHPSKPSLIAGWFLDVPLSVFMPPGTFVSSAVWTFSWWLGIPAAAIIAAALVVVLVLGDRRARLVAACFAMYAVVIWFAAVWANTVDTGDPGFDVLSAPVKDFVRVWFSSSAFVPSRYSLVPSMCLAALILLAAAKLHDRRIRVGRDMRVPATLSVGALLLVLAISFSAPFSTRDGGPSWTQGVHGARAACAAQDPTTLTSVETAPSGWAAEAPCSVFMPR